MERAFEPFAIKTAIGNVCDLQAANLGSTKAMFIGKEDETVVSRGLFLRLFENPK